MAGGVCQRWELWTGVDRDQALGKPLAQLIEPAGTGRPPIDWADMCRAASGGERFVLHCMKAPGVGRPARAAALLAAAGRIVAAAAQTRDPCGLGSALVVNVDDIDDGRDTVHGVRTFDLSFRPAARDVLDQDTPPIGEFVYTRAIWCVEAA